NSGSSGDTATKLDAEMKTDLEKLETQTKANQAAVIDALLNAVYDVKPQLHANFKQGQRA
ncbi:hypothetical protein SARC_13085, partial [Sphaeroforma arctica JP610]